MVASQRPGGQVVQAWVPSHPRGHSHNRATPLLTKLCLQGWKKQVCHDLLQKRIKDQNKVQTWSSVGQETLGQAKKQGAERGRVGRGKAELRPSSGGKARKHSRGPRGLTPARGPRQPSRTNSSPAHVVFGSLEVSRVL